MDELVKPPNRRTIVVILVLIVAMTATSGLLLLLEPAPLTNTGIQLAAVEQRTDPAGLLFATDPVAEQMAWRAVVIEFYGKKYVADQSRVPAAQRYADRPQGQRPTDYHFLIHNGNGGADGQIDMCRRWVRQLSADWPRTLETLYERPFQPTIRICLVGDGVLTGPTQAQLGRLMWLVRQLQQRYHITLDGVRLPSDNPDQAGRTLFPVAAVRQQLLDYGVVMAP